MNKIFSLFFILSTFSSCGQKIESEFPDQIQSSKTEKHIRIEGSKVYGIIPNSYQYIKYLARYQKNDNLYIQVAESNTSSFIQAKSNFTKNAMEAKGATIDVLKNITVNVFDAIYVEGPSKYKGENKLVLAFGDETFMVIIVGVCKNNDINGQKELQEIFKSIYYDKAFKNDPLELASFDFDYSITGFKYTMSVSTIFMFTKDGKIDAQNPTVNSINIGILPQMTEDKAENYSNDLSWRLEQKGITLENKEIIKTKINDYPAYILQTDIELKNKKGIMYQVLLVGKDKCVLFIGNAYNDADNYLTKFKRTAESITIK